MVNYYDILKVSPEASAAEIGDGEGRQDMEEQVTEGLPRTTGAIDAIKAASDLVEVKAGLLAAEIQDAAEIDLICLVFREFLGGPDGHLQEQAGFLVIHAIPFVERAFAIPAGL